MPESSPLESTAYWSDVRYDYSGSDLVYVGGHTIHKAAGTDAGWFVWKYTWTADKLVRQEGPLKGVWDDRATLDWAA